MTESKMSNAGGHTAIYQHLKSVNVFPVQPRAGRLAIIIPVIKNVYEILNLIINN